MGVMQPGDRVIYLRNFPIDLNNDLGTVEELDEDNDPVVLFDDGFRGGIDRNDLALVIEKRPIQPTLF